jgi:hypothetical protein
MVSDDSIMFERPALEMRHVMFELAAEFGLVIVPVDAPPMLVREDQRPHLPPELREEAIVVHDGNDVLHPIYREL